MTLFRNHRCWQCTHPVNADESAGPSEETRVSMAKFNEQMSGMFSIIQTLGDIRFSMEILEPPITELTKEEAPAEAGHKILRVCNRHFYFHNTTAFRLVNVPSKQQVKRGRNCIAVVSQFPLATKWNVLLLPRKQFHGSKIFSIRKPLPHPVCCLTVCVLLTTTLDMCIKINNHFVL